MSILHYPLHTALGYESDPQSAVPRPHARMAFFNHQTLMRRLSPAVHPCSAFVPASPETNSLVQGARVTEKRKDSCAMQDIRRPQTPLFWVFHLLPANFILAKRDCCLNAHDEDFDLQIRDDHHAMNRKSHEYPKKATAAKRLLSSERAALG